MEDASELIINIEESISRIIFLRENEKKEADELKKKVLELQKVIENQQLIIEQLEKNTTITNEINKPLEKGEDNKQTKLKIKEMMREIDRVISLLNS